MLRLALISVTALVWGLPAAAQDDTVRIDRIFSSISANQPGCATGVSTLGQAPIFRSYGLADMDARTPITESTAFDIASVHKQFVAASILLLVEDGKLKLADDVRTYVPELPDYGAVITLNHLLTHTAGLRDWVLLMQFAEDDVDALSLILRQQGVNFEPGEEWSYSNSGYVLLKEIVERATGEPFASFLDQRIFTPLGMTTSAYVADPLQARGTRALAYRREGTGWRQDMRLGRERGGGGVMSSARDLLIWNDALSTGRLSAFVSTELERPTVLNNGRVLSYARGLNVDVPPGERVVSHSGGGAGYSAWLGRFTVNEVSTTVLCNFEPVSATNFAIQVSDVFLPPPVPALTPAADLPAAVDVGAHAGTYIDEVSGEVIRLVANQGRLSIPGRAALAHIAEDRFVPERRQLFYRSEDAFELHFTTPDSLELISMEGDRNSYRRAREWTPSSADLSAAAGRYENAELGADFELVAVSHGIGLRSVLRPDRVLAFVPIERDMFLHEGTGTVLRLVRDRNGLVSGFRHDHPGLRRISFSRLDVREETDTALRAPAQAAAPSGVTSDSNLERFAGEYVMPAGFAVVVSVEAGKLYGQPTGGDRLPLRRRSELTYEVDGATPPTALTFSLDDDGRVAAIVLEVNGRQMTSQARR